MSGVEHSKLFMEVIPRTMRSLRSEIRNVAGNEFTIPQFRLLARISRNPSSNAELAEWMGVSAPTMSKMVDKLIHRGLVKRDSQMEGKDRRLVLIRTTPKGAERTGKIRGAVQEIFARKFSDLPKEKKERLMGGLAVLKELFL